MRRPTHTIGMLMVYVILFLTVVTTLLPLVWMITTSIKTPGEVFVYPPKWIPTEFAWSNYKTAWDMAPWNRYFLNTAFYTASTVIGVLITSVASGYAFSKLEFKGRKTLFLAYIGTMMVPSQVTIIPVFMILSQMNWVDTYTGLIIPGLTSAFGCFLMRQFITGIPTELIESGLIEGGGHMRILGIFTFMGAWNNFFWPLIVTNSDELRTVQVGLSSFQNQYGDGDWGAMMAAATMVSAPVLILFFFAQKYFIEGIAMTGIKG